MTNPDTLDPAIKEIVTLVNARQFDEADKQLYRIEQDEMHAAWEKPLTIMILRDRIREGMRCRPGM